MFTFPYHSGGTSTTAWMPNEFYAKVVFRLKSTSLNQGSSSWGLLNWWSSTFTFGNSWLDINPFEASPYPTGTCGNTSVPNPSVYGSLQEGTCPTSGCTIHFSTSGGHDFICRGPFDFTQYHTQEGLTTSDETSDTTMCTWSDGALNGCTDRPFAMIYDSGYAYTRKDRGLIIGVNANTATIVNDLHAYVKSIEIWSCPGFATHTCPGTIVSYP